MTFKIQNAPICQLHASLEVMVDSKTLLYVLQRHHLGISVRFSKKRYFTEDMYPNKLSVDWSRDSWYYVTSLDLLLPVLETWIVVWSRPSPNHHPVPPRQHDLFPCDQDLPNPNWP